MSQSIYLRQGNHLAKNVVGETEENLQREKCSKRSSRLELDRDGRRWSLRSSWRPQAKWTGSSHGASWYRQSIRHRFHLRRSSYNSRYSKKDFELRLFLVFVYTTAWIWSTLILSIINYALLGIFTIMFMSWRNCMWSLSKTCFCHVKNIFWNSCY